MLRESPSTRVEAVDDALLAVVNDVQFFAVEASSASTVTSVHQSTGHRQRAHDGVRAMDRLRGAVQAGETFRSPAELLAHLLRDQADVLVEIVRDATKQVDAFEDRLIGNQTTSRPKLGALRRMLVRLQRLLAPEPAALFRLLSRPPVWLSEDDVADLRQSAEELAAAVADSAALVERTRLLQEELTALLNEQTNRTLYVLTFVTVLALPMTIIPGFFGMNVGGIPFSGSAGGFWAVLVVVCGRRRTGGCAGVDPADSFVGACLSNVNTLTRRPAFAAAASDRSSQDLAREARPAQEFVQQLGRLSIRGRTRGARSPPTRRCRRRSRNRRRPSGRRRPRRTR